MEARFRGQAAEEFGVKPTLKEKLTEHYKKRDFTVKRETANKYGVTYFLLCLLVQYIVGMRTVMPGVCDSENILLWKCFLTLVFVQSFYHWFMCCRKYVNKVEKRAEDEKKEKHVSLGWVYCGVCQQPCPPRAHHCNLCKVCVLRHDHHCFFAGGCIGFFTVSHFIYMCLWLLISQITAAYLQGYYMASFYTTWWDYIPWVVLFNAITSPGTDTFFHLLLIVNVALIIANLSVVTIYFVMEVLSMWSNVTFYEGSKGIRRYNKGGVLANSSATLGPFWWIRWLVPIPASPEGDGYDWTSYMKHYQ